MKKIFTNSGVLFLALSFGFGLTACNNDDHHNVAVKYGAGGPMSSVEGKRIKTIQTMDETITFTYDAEGRIVKMTERDNDDIDVKTYEYNGNTIVASEYGDNGKVDDVTEYTVTDGLIAKSKERGTLNADKKVFKYEGNRLVEYAEDRNEKDLYTWLEGNISLLRETDDDDADELTNYSYSIDVSNSKLELMIVTDCDPVLVLQGYMGQGTTNQLSSIGEGVETSTCTYTRDADGNVISIAFARTGKATKTMNITWE